ncbi:hypothetical protein, partial [Bifidobacterium cebidarum]|uniref:hypothetical protein n=1 Tax=Bifidobacterium cebidarum TaxID=2650773 RepID=UPI001D02D73F
EPESNPPQKKLAKRTIDDSQTISKRNQQERPNKERTLTLKKPRPVSTNQGPNQKQSGTRQAGNH